MSQTEDIFELSCRMLPALSGQYIFERKNYYLQAGGFNKLSKHSNGMWGVGDGKTYIILSADTGAILPSDVKNWRYLLGGKYVPCPEMVLTRPKPARSPNPPVQQPTIENQNTSKSGDSVSDWEVKKEKDAWTGAVQTYYVNIHTGVRQTAVPEVILAEQSKPPNLCGYEIESVTGKGALVTIYAPTKHAQESGKGFSKVLRSEAWPDIEVFWSKGMQVLENEIRIAQHALLKLRSYEKNFEEERKTLTETIARMERQLNDVQEREKMAMLRSDVMVNRLGKGHIKRDGQAVAGADFPCGQEIIQEFQESFRNFEAFAYDVTNILEDMRVTNSTDVFVEKIMMQIFKFTRDYVSERIQEKHTTLEAMFGVTVEDEEASAEDSIAKQFFYSTQQTQLLRRIQDMDEDKITRLMQEMGPLVNSVHAAMEAAAAVGQVNKELSVVKLVKLLLRMHAVSELSDPRCYLFPSPHLGVAYKEGLHVEILSPSTKTFGRIKEGEVVEVVLPGLYFDNPAVVAGPPAASVSRAGGGRGMGASGPPKGKATEAQVVRPAVPCLVRRLVGGGPSKDKVIGK